MNKVKILTDSTVDLYNIKNRDLLKEMDVDTIPLYVSFENEVYQDGVSISASKMYELVKEKGYLPKSSCASPQDYADFFKKYVDQGYDIVFIGIGSELSGGNRTATIAAGEFDDGRVYIYNSNNLSSAIGLQVHQAVMLRDKGLSAKEIVEKMESEKLASRVRCSFVIDTLDYLYKGGRCSGMAKIFGTLFAIKPLISVVDGKLIVASKDRGKKNGLNTMFKNFQADWEKGNVVKDRIMITRTTDYDEMEYLRNKMHEIGVPDEIIVDSFAGCVIGTHCGPRTIGILYILKENA